MAPLAALAAGLVRAGISDRWARPLAGVVAVGAIVLLVWWAAAGMRASIVNGRDAEVRATAAERQLDRQSEADADELPRRATDAAEADHLKGVLENAVDHDPRAGSAAAGPGTNAVLGELRARQQRPAEQR